MAVVLLFFYMIMMGILIATYIMNAIGYQTIASRRGIKCPWLAWIPFANYWILGSIADEYDCRNGKRSSKRKILLILSIIAEVLLGIFLALSVIIMRQIMAAEHVAQTYEYAISLLGKLVPFLIIGMAAEGVLIALLVIMGISLYKVYRSTIPGRAVLYLLLSVFIPLAQGICLLKCRNEGYPYEESVEEIIPEEIEQKENQQD